MTFEIVCFSLLHTWDLLTPPSELLVDDRAIGNFVLLIAVKTNAFISKTLSDQCPQLVTPEPFVTSVLSVSKPLVLHHERIFKLIGQGVISRPCISDEVRRRPLVCTVPPQKAVRSCTPSLIS